MRKSKPASRRPPPARHLPDPGPLLPPRPVLGGASTCLVICRGRVTSLQLETLRTIFEGDSIRLIDECPGETHDA